MTMSLMLLFPWALAIGLTIWGTWLALRHVAQTPPHLDRPFNLFPVTVLKPLKGAESGIFENLASFFRLDYPNYEIIFSVADANDPVVPVIQRLIADHPAAPARLIVGDLWIGPNPKVNNMIRGYREAKYDWVVISDSNVRVAPDYLKRMVAHLDLGVGIMTSLVAGQNAEGIGGNLEATFLNTYYARGMSLAFAVKQPVVLGKSMMFRKSVAARFGGLEVLSRYLAEDYICGEAVRQLGLRTVMATDPVAQHIGQYSFSSFWARHIRWGRIRKMQSPLLFWFEPFLGIFASAIFGALAFQRLFGISPVLFACIHLTLWSVCDLLLMRRLGQKVEVKMPLFWFGRELLGLPMWLHIASGNTVNWRGERLKLQSGGILEANPPALSGATFNGRTQAQSSASLSLGNSDEQPSS
ncbi:MAG: ceramide glucosyltransferase [Oligoflexia bacterium]|nr:ceramide glucosyltransferase [Oligoflexia bacterium]